MPIALDIAPAGWVCQHLIYNQLSVTCSTLLSKTTWELREDPINLVHCLDIQLLAAITVKKQ